MTKFQSLIAAVAALLAGPVFAHDGVHIEEAYARANGMSGAVFFVVDNHQIEDDRLLTAASEIAEKTELHTHKENAEGVMQMIHVEEGFVIPAMEKFALQRGGAHVMLMGLKQDLKDGDVFKVTLTFERAGEVSVDVKVDNAHKETQGNDGHMQHGQADHGTQTSHDTHGAHSSAAEVDTTGLSDVDAITAVMKAQFDTPDNPLTVEPVTVEGDHALAGWAQGDKGGRALLERRHGAWEIVLCGGPELRMPEFIGGHGVSSAEALSRLYNAAEDSLGVEKVNLLSSFEGVVLISPMQ